MSSARERADAFASWAEHHRVFERDSGMLRDVYVRGPTLADWKAMLELVLQNYPAARLTRSLGDASVDVPIPDDLATLFEPFEQRAHLSVPLAELELVCYFFAAEEIELSFAPEPATETSLRPLLAFLIELGDALGREVLLTAENLPAAVYFRYEPAEQRLTWYPESYYMP